MSETRLIAAFLGLLAFPSVASASVIQVCPSCADTTIASGLSGAVSGDVVTVAAGTWAECFLSVPAGVTLEGTGASTIVDGTACGAGALVYVGEGGGLDGLRLEPSPAAGTGASFLGSGTAIRLEVRGGYKLLAGPNDANAIVQVESSVLVGGASTVAGIDAGFADWSLQQVTLSQTAGATAVGVSGASATVDVRESLLTGWGTAVLGSFADCYVALSALSGNGTDLDGCDDPDDFTNWAADPVFVDPVSVLGDFHLQSTVGEWVGGSFVPGLADSPYLALGTPDATRADAENAGPCNLPNLGGYGGTAEASRSAAAVCAVTNLDTGVGYRSLADAAAVSGAAGEVLELQEGVQWQHEPAVFWWSPTVIAAPGADVQVRAAWTSNEPLIQMRNGVAAPVLTIEGMTIGPDLDGGGVALGPGQGYRSFTLSLEGCVVLGDRAIDGGTWRQQTLTVTNSSLGTPAAPITGTAILFDLFTSNTNVAVIDSAIWATGACLQFMFSITLTSGHSRYISVSGSALRCGGYGVADTWGQPDSRLQVENSVIVGGGSGLQFNQVVTPDSYVRNSLIVTTGGTATVWTGSPVSSLVNNTFVGGATTIDIGDQAGSSQTVVNNLLFGASATALVSGDAPTGLLPQYNLFWDNGANAAFPLDFTNVTTCDPGFPPPPSDPLDPTWDPAVYIPGPTNCLVNAGHPAGLYNDVDGTRNDIGATGGPGGGDFLALFDLDGDGYAGTADCDDADPLVNAGASDVCGDGVDSDCSGGDAPDNDSDGYEDLACSTATLPADCDDADASLNPAATDWSCDTIDQDCDGADETDFDGDGYACDVDDCDDADATISPGASEVCDGLDNDCDGALLADEGDDDGDGFLACASVDPDCDDASATSFPGATELCDGLDNDCDAAVPADEVDGDGDGSLACADCDDADAANFPGNPEVCDAADNDCDGVAETGGEDNDGDGAALCDAPPDCDDDDPANFPNNPFGEVCAGQDNDCSGAPGVGETDGDGDGQMPCAGDCDDADADNLAGNLEVCDGADNDCDGFPQASEVDGDGDGVMVCAGDCDDDAVLTLPESAELCDGFDNDCDGALGADEVDEDGDGALVCAGDCDDNEPTTYPTADELCDGVDNDCDGAPDADEVDEDADGKRICAGDCDDTRISVGLPAGLELCDGLDNDCDGALPDEEADADEDGWLACGSFRPEEPAAGLLGGGDCDDAEAGVSPGAEELCDGVDTDCDGELRGDEVDADADGYAACTDFSSSPWSPLTGGADCNDALAAVYPSAPELCDAIDQDCDNDLVEDFDDRDADGFPDCTSATVPAPGCDVGCDTGGGSVPVLPALLVLPLVGWRRRR